jgi:hypothetical protein
MKLFNENYVFGFKRQIFKKEKSNVNKIWAYPNSIPLKKKFCPPHMKIQAPAEIVMRKCRRDWLS